MEAKIVILEKFVNQFWRLLENNIESIDGDVFSAGATIYMNDIVEDEITEERILRTISGILDGFCKKMYRHNAGFDDSALTPFSAFIVFYRGIRMKYRKNNQKNYK